MHRLTLILIALFLFGCIALPASAQANRLELRDANSFQELYGQRYLASIRSPESSDDISLARDMVKHANGLAGRPHLVKQLLDHAYDLCKPHAEGRRVALTAMNHLSKRQPEMHIYALNRKLLILETQYNAVGTGSRNEVIRELMRTQVQMGDYFDRINDVNQAAMYFRKAETLSKKHPAIQVDRVDGRNRRYDQRMLVETQVADARRAFSQGAQINKAAQKLLMLYIAKTDRPELAMQYLTYSRSEATKKLLPMAAKHPLELTPTESKELADWYAGIAPKLQLAGQPMMYRRALIYTNHYLRSIDPTSAEFNVVRNQRRLIQQELQKMTQSHFIPKQYAGQMIRRNQWIDLLPMIHPRKNAWFGRWQKGPSGALTNESGRFSTIIAPLYVDGNYQISTAFKCTRGSGSVAVSFPVFDRMATVHLSAKDFAGLEMIDGFSAMKVDNPTRTPLKLMNHQWYQLEINVRMDSARENVTIKADLDGKNIINYKTRIDSLSAYEGWAAGEADEKDTQQVILMGSSNRSISIRKLAINVFSGNIQLNNYDYTQPD